MPISRRSFAKHSAALAAAGLLPRFDARALAQSRAMPKGRLATSAEREIAPGPFQPTWESLRGGYQPPDWFRDAKFGMWAHWSAQCVPEQGDWYARRMYMQGDAANKFHVEHYGHPSKVGFKDIDCRWNVDAWRPDELLDLYQKTGAKYFMALAVHHDNFDCWNSRFHDWNAARLGPKRDIVGTWRKLVRERGMRFSVSNHSSHAWHWLQTSYGYDPEGPMAGVRYDAYQLQGKGRVAGNGTKWSGHDADELYVGPTYALPDGIKTIAEANKWHEAHDRVWDEGAPPLHPEFVNSWYLRCKDLVDTYEPDMLYFDDDELPLGQAGLDVTAHYYNRSVAKHGHADVVVTGKHIRPEYKGAIVLDLERGRTDRVLDEPWQVDTCIGDWHYRRSLYEENKYKTPTFVIHTLLDAVSKNGNLCLNIPVRGDGSIDDKERAVVEGVGAWIRPNAEGIFGSRPFSLYGEGRVAEAKASGFDEEKRRPFDATDIRFTTNGGKLYAYALGWPADGKLRIRSLAAENATAVKKVARVEMMGSSEPLRFEQTRDELVVTLPEQRTSEIAVGLRIASANGPLKGSV
ncbi:alpha-L-fucosidase [Bryocella elongata]|uniref:alpha-L-fucosidase n=1 Tax=Bryocella elongata TaxID=863522 RepID=A0A1H6BXK8_9BACT|nr:alpha-L-fucosidase [Bryocella elongata]SEG65430.1 alpha-L-fucosidase [Bryocella elongata]